MNTNKKCGGCNPRTLQKNLDRYLDSFHFNKKLTKRQRLIAFLVIAQRLDFKVTRFDAELIGCHCWNTSVSEITKYNGIKIERRDTKRPTRFGETHCREYWLDPSVTEQAESYIQSLAAWEPRDGQLSK